MPCLNKMRIGIFGGAFDPPHKGHEKAVRAFLEKAQLDLLYVIPSGKPPHKTISGAASDADRLEMSRRAFLSISDKIIVSDREISDRGTCYSYLTVEGIREEYPGSEIFLFIGTDQFLAFETWRRFEYILKMCTLCVMDRFNASPELIEKKAWLEENFGARVLLLQEKPYIISSTDIRRELSEWGFSLSLSPDVNEWIAIKGIYSSRADAMRQKLLDRAKKELSPHRFSHTLSVEREAVRLSRLLCLSDGDVREMALAALYHDLAKNLTDEQACSFLEKKGECVSEEDRAIPAVLHGRVSAIFAEEDGELSEDAVCAVRYHTTGRAGMSLKEMILYFADYIEETRSHDACRKMRAEFYDNMPENNEGILLHFYRCVYRVMENTAYYLMEQKIPCHSLGAQALADLKRRID
ncbi:MAG: nicotinate (nicotinamide) nucleotide adenylyltransferase [Clostridia bacterium]|nr:nicotinate (nicotinamide) nucleotide adenylyltransferase [Clostridia bacterium]